MPKSWHFQTEAVITWIQVTPLTHLSRRERQIMDALYRLEKANASQIREAISEPPSYTAVRTTLGILETKGALTHTEVAGKYVYTPAVPIKMARASAVRNLLDTFFEGSAGQAALSLLGSSRRKLTPEQIERLSQLVQKAKQESSE